MCSSCGGRPAKTYTVTYPGGRTEIKHSAVAAQNAAAKVEGATWTETPK